MNHLHPNTEGAVEVEDDGFATLIVDHIPPIMRDATPAKPGGGDKPSQPPQSRAERLRASMASDLDEAQVELQGIETQMIVADETAAAATLQARAEYQQKIAAAKREMDKVLGRVGEDRAEAMAALEASKADVLGIVAILTEGLEGQKPARSPVEMAG